MVGKAKYTLGYNGALQALGPGRHRTHPAPGTLPRSGFLSTIQGLARAPLSEPPTMQTKHARQLAYASTLLTPVALMAITAVRWRTGPCAASAHASVWALMAFAALLAASKNPYRAIAACIMYLPVGYMLTTEPCTAARSQGAGGLIYLLSPLFALWVLIGAFIGGWLLRVVLGLSPETPQQKIE